MNSYLKEIAKCTRCGNCQYYCPTYSVSRIESYTARGRLELIKTCAGGTNEGYSDTFIKRMNQCLLCGNCSSICPSGINIENIIEEVRALSIKDRGPSEGFGYASRNINSTGNITGDNPENRLLWFKNIEDKISDLKIFEPAEYVYLTGCVPALYPSSYSIPQSFVIMLKKAGLDFTLLGDRENCCGYPLVIGGMPEEAMNVLRKNAETLKKLKIKKAITTCPSCYHMWSKYYAGLSGKKPDMEIIHGTQILHKLLSDGSLKMKEINRIITYHDPCDLGRKSGIYDIPRDIIKCIPGVQLREMKYSKEDARCCGGGGNLEMNDSALGEKVSANRVSQAIDTGSDTIVTACQQCKRTLIKGARQIKARIKVMDISELIMEAIV